MSVRCPSRALGRPHQMALPASGVAGRATTLYMRADLPDLLAASRRRAAGIHFLAAFDEVHVGYKDRACLTDAAGERLICPAANSMFRPLLVDRGRVVAVRPAGAGLLWADDARRSARYIMGAGKSMEMEIYTAKIMQHPKISNSRFY